MEPTTGPDDPIKTIMAHIENSRKPRFDGTVNLGHIMQLIVIIAGLWIWGTKAEVRTSQLEARIAYVEMAQRDFSASMRNISEGQNRMAITQERMAATLDHLAKTQDIKQGAK